MITFAIILLLVCALYVLYMAITAPEGYEDDENNPGFHYGKHE